MKKSDFILIQQKYYFIYFDVSENAGIRNILNETQDITQSGNIIVGEYSFVEGWSAQIVEPANDSYSLINTPVNITVSMLQ